MVGLRGLYGPVGGIEAALDALVPRLADRGLELDVFCRSRYQRLPTRLRPGVRLVNIPTVYTKHLETFVYTALAQLRPGDVDVVHFHALGPTLFAPFPRLRGIKVVSTIHGLDWERPKWGPVARAALRTGGWLSATVPHATVVVSHTLQAHYLARYDRHTHVIPNGVTERPSRPLNRLRRFGLEPEGFLLFLGRLVPDKGCDLRIAGWKYGVRVRGLEDNSVVTGLAGAARGTRGRCPKSDRKARGQRRHDVAAGTDKEDGACSGG